MQSWQEYRIRLESSTSGFMETLSNTNAQFGTSVNTEVPSGQVDRNPDTKKGIRILGCKQIRKPPAYGQWLTQREGVKPLWERVYHKRRGAGLGPGSIYV